MSWALWGMLAPAWAHVPNIASFNLDVLDGQSVLLVSLPTDGMHHALKLKHPELTLSELDTQAYQALLTQTLLDGVALELDGVPASLGPCRVNLAAHETQAQCSLSAAPVYQVSAQIDAFSAQHGQNNVLRVRTHPSAGHIVLKESNAFQGQLQLSEPEVSEQEWPWAWGSLLLLPVGFWLWTLSSRPSQSASKQ